MRRKCAKCGEYIIVTIDNINSVIIYNKQSYHDACFEQLCAEKMENSRTKTKWTGIYSSINDIRKTTYKSLSISLKKDEIFQWMCEQYYVSMVDGTTFQKLADIYEGKWKGQCYPIGPEELLDEWKYYIRDLIDTRKTKGITGNAAIKYDLTILLNWNADYRKEMKKKAAQEEARKSEIADQPIDYQETVLMGNNIAQQLKNDTADLFNEIR